MSFWKKTMDYLGLGPDDAYDDPEEMGRWVRLAYEAAVRVGAK